jgi:hypothetical protein
VVPKELVGYFTTSAQIAGSLIGLLFVSISLRYEAILGKSAEFRSRALASITFIGLFNVLTISIWALVPSGSRVPGTCLGVHLSLPHIETAPGQARRRRVLVGQFSPQRGCVPLPDRGRRSTDRSTG